MHFQFLFNYCRFPNVAILFLQLLEWNSKKLKVNSLKIFDQFHGVSSPLFIFSICFSVIFRNICCQKFMILRFKSFDFLQLLSSLDGCNKKSSEIPKIIFFQKGCFCLLQWKPFKNDKKCFISCCFWDVYIFFLSFWLGRKTSR